MNITDAKLKKIASLVHSLENELDVLESAHHLQFESTASLQDKLSASKRAGSALAKARRLSNLIAQMLVEPNQ